MQLIYWDAMEKTCGQLEAILILSVEALLHLVKPAWAFSYSDGGLLLEQSASFRSMMLWHHF